MKLLKKLVIYLYKRLDCESFDAPIEIPETLNIDCTISTPQFKNQKVHKMCVQDGTFYRDTLIFHPYNCISGHDVHFQSFEDFHDSVIKIL